MNVTLTTKRVSQLSELEYKRCKRLTFAGEPGVRRGTMQAELVAQRNKGTKSTARAILTKDSSGTIIAWALVWQKQKNSALERWHFYMYVMPSHRRKGLGSKLLTRARLGRSGRIYVYPHDHTSRCVYDPIIDGKRIWHG